MKHDITTIEDIKTLVDNFYTRVRGDEKLAPIFNDKIGDQWSVHLEKMYRFWQTVLLNEHTYSGSPFLPHAQLPVDESHFKLWIQLFTETIEEHFAGEKANEAVERASNMAIMFQSKIAYYQNKQPLK